MRLMLLTLLCSSLFAEQKLGKVVQVHTGDTFTISVNGVNERVILREVSCPLSAQRFFKEARQFTMKTILGHLVRVEFTERTPEGHILGEVTYGPNVSLARQLLQSGLAWWNASRGTIYHFKTLETRAKAKRKGLWVDPNAIPPWQYYEVLAQKQKQAKESKSAEEKETP